MLAVPQDAGDSVIHEPRWATPWSLPKALLHPTHCGDSEARSPKKQHRG